MGVVEDVVEDVEGEEAGVNCIIEKQSKKCLHYIHHAYADDIMFLGGGYDASEEYGGFDGGYNNRGRGRGRGRGYGLRGRGRGFGGGADTTQDGGGGYDDANLAPPPDGFFRGRGELLCVILHVHVCYIYWLHQC